MQIWPMYYTVLFLITSGSCDCLNGMFINISQLLNLFYPGYGWLKLDVLLQTVHISIVFSKYHAQLVSTGLMKKPQIRIPLRFLMKAL